MRKIDENLEMWYLVNYITNKVIREAKKANLGVAFCAQYNALRPEYIKKVLDNGLTAACWTVDDKDLLLKMLDCGVRYITTNSNLPRAAELAQAPKNQ